MHSTKPSQTGITLVELLVAVALLAVSLAVAAPAYRVMIDTNRLSAGVNAFSGSLQLARSEAVRRGQRVTLCVSDDGKNCSTTGGWHRGWIVFHDPDGNAQRDSSEALIQVQAALQFLSIRGNQPVTRYVSYTEHGWPRLVSGALQMGTLAFCTPGIAGHSLILSSAGRARLSGAACSSV
ncbi:MAG: type IV fimbrial biogenesis protein FimT [Burkholderiales bacterium]|nr:type IV fimbrial biogenesis protein FimT [Burkholderiales bacterium]